MDMAIGFACGFATGFLAFVALILAVARGDD